MASPAALNVTSAGLWVWAQETLLGDSANYNSSQLLETLQSTLTSAVKRQYLQNDYFAGGVGLMLIGGVAARGKWAVSKAWEFLRRKRGVVTVYVSPEDPAYGCLQQWLSEHCGKDSAQLNLQSKYEYDSDGDDDESTERSARAAYKLLFVPKLQEAQKFEYKGETVTFQVETRADVLNKGQSGDVSSLLKSLASKDALVITAVRRETIEELITEAMAGALALVEEKKFTNIKRWSTDEYYWDCIGSRPIRPLQSVVLDGQIETLVKDARTFLASSKWYSDRGVPHRRGYLLHGPPGCGKSSSILALAGELNLDVNLIGLSSKDMNDEMLHTAFSRCDNRSILVLEDIDAAFAQRDGQNANTLSFSGLLNCIDGVCAQEGRILIMTTNHLDKLDPALTRPGRCDLHLHLGLATRTQITTMYKRFYPEASEDDVATFADRVPEGTVSPAKLQGYFLLHRDDRETALADIPELTSTAQNNAQENAAANEDAPVGDSPSTSGAEAKGVEESESESGDESESNSGIAKSENADEVFDARVEKLCKVESVDECNMQDKVDADAGFRTVQRSGKSKRLARMFSCIN